MVTSYLAILPELILILLAAVVLVYGRHPKGDVKRNVGLMTAWGALAALVVTIGISWLGVPGPQSEELWGGMFRNDGITMVFRTMFIAATMLTAMLTVDVKRLQHGEYYALMLLATVGFNLMAAAGDLIMLYLALETVSIAFYILAAFATDDRRSPEAGIKYFVYGAFASVVMLYGMSFLYGLTNETNIQAVAEAVSSGIIINGVSGEGLLVLASVLVIAGFGFKVSAVPFHFWSLDVYEGAPTSTTALLSTASKAAGFSVFLRLFMSGTFGAPSQDNWYTIIVIMAIFSLVLGNFGAFWQTNIKRLLAYSGIGQAGYLLIALATYTPDGAGSILFYLYMYMFTNIAAFGVIILVSNVTGSDEISDLNGLSRRNPWLAVVMLFSLLSLGGIPPAAGFFGKFFIFKAAVEAGNWQLALFGIVMAFIALFYYLNVIKAIYLYRNEDESPLPVSRVAGFALAICTIGILWLGVVPGQIFDWTLSAAQAYFTG
ncbi:MAG: NADH-quinone oxidoreductase subunit N [Anaerolineae bacterium]